MEYRLVSKWGCDLVEIRYAGTEWSGWYFETSKEPKKNWIYISELKVYRRNISAF